jgi:NAD(P)-dependent dehydrogenase (short-subunit alcohol dehydrogenase family)
MKTVIVFGASGGIGNAVVDSLSDSKYNVIPITRNEIDFVDPEVDEKVSTLLDYHRPQIVINCVGYLATNNEGSEPTLSANIGSNWSILRYYIDQKEVYNPVNLIMVGSSAYREGKKQYMMYSASKAALHNLWQGAVDYFAGTNISINLIHPVRTRTKMTVNRFSPDLDYFEPEEVAQEILKLVESPSRLSKCTHLTFKDKK